MPFTEDQQLEDILDMTQEYLHKQQKLQETLKEAYMNLAKAKYSADDGRLGQTSFNMDMQASTRVLYNEESKRFELCATEDSQQSSEGHNNDPIRWFGAFPSLALRQAQRAFMQALKEVIELAQDTQQLVIATRE
eukprot:TRINITY_DN6193_c0_g3_i4.p6 TRINITY_DN6193_c0_g3~~TRINITY_DN6193_c0_g3_i4.p6  ORF type:complete len:135 (+),score=16.80 TRINITY_DN6193_c0_g3_i4:1388-1792(+)